MLNAAPYQQILDPVGSSFGLSSIFAVLPLLTLFVLLGGLKLKAWIAGLVSLAVAVVVAIFVYDMPVSQSLLSASEGAVFGFFPILWVVINAIWVYNLTVATGHFDVLRRSFEKVSPDQRIQAVIIAFCFGGLLEALAGFGTPVAISVVMLMALGFAPIKAATLALLANTAPVAFGALATPIVTLAAVTSGVQPDNPDLTVDILGGDGRPADAAAGAVRAAAARLRRRRQARPAPDLAARDRLRCRVLDRPVRLRQLHLRPARRHHRLAGRRARRRRPAACVAAGRVAGPGGPPWGRTRHRGRRGWRRRHDRRRRRRHRRHGRRGGRGGSGGGAAMVGGGDGAVRERQVVDSGAEIAKAYAPYAIIIAIFSITNIPSVKEALGVEPWTYKFAWPGLDVLTPPASRRRARPSASAGSPRPARS